MTRYIIDSGDTTLDVFVAADADLDGIFLATDAETGERLRVNGWMIDSMEKI